MLIYLICEFNKIASCSVLISRQNETSSLVFGSAPFIYVHTVGTSLIYTETKIIVTGSFIMISVMGPCFHVECN